MAHVSLLNLYAYGRLYTPVVHHLVLWQIDETDLINDAVDNLDSGEVAIALEAMTFSNYPSSKMIKLMSPRGIVGWVHFEGLKEVT